jgi:hypothetical protein
MVPVSEQNEYKNLLVLGRVAALRMQNRWHKELALKNYLKVNGRLPHLTGVGDTLTAILQIIGAYSTQELAEGGIRKDRAGGATGERTCSVSGRQKAGPCLDAKGDWLCLPRLLL